MKMLKLFLTAFLVFILLFSAKSQWIPCQGIEGANCNSITQQDSFLFIEGHGGIYRRNINDSTWDSDCLIGGFRKIRSTGSALFCFGGNVMSDLYRSIDNGFTWEDISMGYGYRNIECVDSIIFLDTENNGLLSSADDGESWNLTYPSPDSSNVEWISSQEGILFCFLENVDTLFRSDNYGSSWITYPMTGVDGIGNPYLFNGNLWLASRNQFYIFNSFLDEWIIQQDSLPEQIYSVSFIEDSETLCCYTNDGFFRYNNQDLTWEDESQGLENSRCWDACRVGNSIYLATDSGPFIKSECEDWLPDYDDLFGIPVTQVFVVGSRTYALAKGNIYFSDDIPNGFEKLASQDYCPPRRMIVTDTAWYLGSDCGFLISVDSGQTWTAQNAGIEGIKILDIAVTDQYYFAQLGVWGSPLFRTRVDSIAWEKAPNEWVSSDVGDIDAINNVLFARSFAHDSIYKSEDYGTTFGAILDPGDDMAHFFVKDDKIYILSGFENVVFSDDYGLSWKILISDLESDYIDCMDITGNLETTVIGGFVGPWDPVNYLSMYSPDDPYGEDITENLPAYQWSQINQVLFDDSRIYVCPSSGGLWYRDDLMVNIKEDDLSKKQPSDSLQIFPNPVNDFLTIDLQENGDQSEYLIFDQLGKIMKRNLLESDNSEITIDVSGFPQGVYYIVIRNGKDNLPARKFVKID